MAERELGDVWGICNGCGMEVTQGELAAREDPCCDVATYRLWVQVNETQHTMLSVDVTDDDDPAWETTFPGVEQ